MTNRASHGSCHRQHLAMQPILRIGFRQSLRLLARPHIWALSALFFVVATPFELDQSGIVYLLKICALLGMIAYAVVARGAQIGRFSLLVMAIVVVMFLTNLSNLTTRTVIAVAAIIAGALLGQTRGDKWNDEFRFIIKMYLAVHCSGLLYAALLFYGAGKLTELHDIVFPHISRTEAYGIVGRLSGFHNEPGTYSQWMLLSLYLLALAQGRLYSIWNAFIAFSVVITVSLWGVLAFGIFAAAFIIEMLLSQTKSNKSRIFLSFVLFVLVVIIIVLNAPSDVVDDVKQYLMLKGEMDTQSGIDKIYAMEFMRKEFLDVFVLGGGFDPGFCPKCISPQDSGVGMTGTYYFGFVLFATLIVTLMARIFRLWGISFIIPFALLLVWKAHVYEPLLWVIIGYIMKGPVKRRLALVDTKI